MIIEILRIRFKTVALFKNKKGSKHLFRGTLPLPMSAKPKTLLINFESTIADVKYLDDIKPSDINFSIKCENINHMVHIYKRPHVDQFIKEMSKFYEIGIIINNSQSFVQKLSESVSKRQVNKNSSNLL